MNEALNIERFCVRWLLQMNLTVGVDNILTTKQLERPENSMEQAYTYAYKGTKTIVLILFIQKLFHRKHQQHQDINPELTN